MKFRTEIEIEPLPVKIGFGNRIMSLGSCFADRIAERLRRAGLHVTANPTGVLFNPESIARTMERLLDGRLVEPSELRHADGRWFHYDFHGSLGAATAAEALRRMNEAVTAGSEALRAADRIILTFGTAWVYDLRDGSGTVANCHRRPADLFERRRLEVGRIVERFETLLQRLGPQRHVLLTVSPIRHLKDGLAENALSKSILRVATGILSERHPNVHYFPAFEILCDDLRDYRFYADDLVHPSAQAVEYVWERFRTAALEQRVVRTLPVTDRIAAAIAHRPEDPASQAYKDFCRKQIEQIDSIPEADLSEEKAFFLRRIQINS